MSKGLEIVPIKDKTKLESPSEPHPPSTAHSLADAGVSGKFLRKEYDDCQHDPKQADV